MSPPRDPISLLPGNMRSFARGRSDYVWVAGWVVLALLLASGLGAGLATDGINVGGEDGFKLGAPSAEGTRIFTQGMRKLELEYAGQALAARERDGTTALRATAEENGVTIRNEAGGAPFRLERKDDGGLVIRDATGAVLYRVKVKLDKVNIYDGGEQRIRSCKLKKGRVLVRDGEGANLFAITGTSQLERAALLALPLPALVRATLFAAVERP